MPLLCRITLFIIYLYTPSKRERERERERAHIPVNIHKIVFTVLEKKIRYCTVLIIYIYAILTSIHPLLKIFKMHYSFSYANKLFTSLIRQSYELSITH
jgi:hypothetical protein